MSPSQHGPKPTQTAAFLPLGAPVFLGRNANWAVWVRSQLKKVKFTFLYSMALPWASLFTSCGLENSEEWMQLGRCPLVQLLQAWSHSFVPPHPLLAMSPRPLLSTDNSIWWDHVLEFLCADLLSNIKRRYEKSAGRWILHRAHCTIRDSPNFLPRGGG